MMKLRRQWPAALHLDSITGLFRKNGSRRRHPQTAFCVAAEVLEVRSLLSAGALDPTFGSGGIVTAQVTGPGAIYPTVGNVNDGKIVAQGGVYNPSTKVINFAVARYQTNGSLDPTFGSGGTVVTAVGQSSSGASAVAIQSDGKVVAVGRGYSVTQSHGSTIFDSEIALLRYNVNGTLDTTFGTPDKKGNRTGITITNLASTKEFAHEIALQSDGKILVAGEDPASHAILVARYKSDGTLDTTFGSGGIVETTITTGKADYVNDMKIQFDGRILVAGSSYSGNWLLVRYTSAGALDTTLGGTGIVQTSILSGGEIDGLALQSDGKIIAAGGAQIILPSGELEGVGVLARYNSDGSLDTSFGATVNYGGDPYLSGLAGMGIVATNLAAAPVTDQYAGGPAAGVVLQPDGRIVTVNQDYWTDVVRHNVDGTLDATFGLGGVARVRAFDVSNYASGLALQADGNIVTFGSIPSSGLLMRFQGGSNVLTAPVSASGTSTPKSLATAPIHVGSTSPPATPASGTFNGRSKTNIGFLWDILQPVI